MVFFFIGAKSAVLLPYLFPNGVSFTYFILYVILYGVFLPSENARISIE